MVSVEFFTLDALSTESDTKEILSYIKKLNVSTTHLL